MGMLLYMEELKRNSKAKKEEVKEVPASEPIEAKKEEPVRRGRPARRQTSK